jgi:hypothetical protein
MRRIIRHRPSPAMTVAFIALLVGLGGVAVASIPGRGGVIKACSSKSTGSLRAIDSKKSCKRSERRLSWNQRGARGLQGIQGSQGVQGPQGITGDTGPSTGPAGGDLSGSYPNPTLAPPEGFHEVGAAGEPGFEHSWTNAGDANETVAFYKDREGVVHLKGVATGGTSSTVIFQLPEGYRPASGKVLGFAVNPGGTVQVDGSGFTSDFVGAVLPGTAGSGHFSVNGITFRAAS